MIDYAEHDRLAFVLELSAQHLLIERRRAIQYLMDRNLYRGQSLCHHRYTNAKGYDTPPPNLTRSATT